MSKKYAVISTDNNPEYANLIPLAAYSWHKIGYKPIVLMAINNDLNTDDFKGEVWTNYTPTAIFDYVTSCVDVRTSTTAQVSRLFSACLPYLNDDDVIVTSDSDMIIGKDIFTEEGDFISYGFDLTGFYQTPICYLKSTKRVWGNMMKVVSNSYITSEILRQLPQETYSAKWEDYWSIDQTIITQRAKEYGMDKILFVNRGNDPNNHGLAKHRWDRYKWENIPAEIIDVHMKRNDLQAQVDVFKRLWPDDDISWLLEFHEKIKNNG